MKSLIIIFCSILLIVALPFIFAAIDDGITSDISESHSAVSTAAAVTTANVTLGQTLYNGVTTSVQSVSSNISGDSPTAYSYNTVSKVLLVSGLAASSNRTLTVNYWIESNTLPTGFGAFLVLLRWFFVLAITGTIIGAIYAFFD